MQNKLTKRQRQKKIVEILSRSQAASQQALLAELEKAGVEATQATVSRDLSELGAVKRQGRYRLPGQEARSSGWKLDFDTAGDHLVVLKTNPGQANMLAVRLDNADIAEIVGTLAGDDTIFVAVKGRQQQGRAIQKILQLLK